MLLTEKILHQLMLVLYPIPTTSVRDTFHIEMIRAIAGPLSHYFQGFSAVPGG